MQDTRSDNTLLDIITCIRKHLLGMFIVFVGIVAVATILTLRQTPIFEVGARVLVKYGREYVYHSVEQVEKGDVSPFLTYNTATIINTELEIFRSPELAEEVVTSLGVDTIFPDLTKGAEDDASALPRAIDKFEAMLNVFHVQGSSVIGVDFQHEDPQVAVQAVSSLIDRFKERHLEIYKNPQFSFLEQQVVAYRLKLQELEEAKIKFKQEHQIFNLEDQSKNLMQQYVKVHTLLIQEEINLDESAAKRISIEKELEVIPEVVVLSEDTTQAGSHEATELHLLQLKLQEHDLLEKYPEHNRLVVAVRQDIKMVEEFLSAHDITLENVRTGKNPLFLKLETELVEVDVNYTAQKEKIDAFNQQLDRLKDSLQKFSKLEIELNRLDEEIESVESNYKHLEVKLGEARIQEAMDTEKMVNVVVIENPRVPVKPIKPNKQLRLLVGIILGAASSLFYALFTEYAMARKI